MKFEFDIDLGKLTDWIQAIANIFVLFLGVLTLIDQKRQIKELKDKDAERKDVEDKAQANLVSVWADEWSSIKIAGSCLNLSNEPIYNVVVCFGKVKKEIHLMKPKEELIFEIKLENQEHLDHPKLDIKFQDASGRKWIRDINGKVSPYPE